MFCQKSLILLAASAICLSVAPAFAMRSQHDAVVSSFGASRDAPAWHRTASQILLAQAQAPGRPLTEREQATVRVPDRPARDPLVRSEPPSPTQPRNPFPQRPANEPRLTNPLSR
jgi:hypothetical protein